MSKNSRRLASQLKIAEFSKRRGGASYLDAAGVAEERLWQLKVDYANAPASYQKYLRVGICTCLESHIKYLYAAAAEAFDDFPDILRELYKDIQVDTDTLISATTKTFGLADIVAASISVSSLAAYRERACHFFSVLTGKQHDFPWDFMNVRIGGDIALRKEYVCKLDRLERIFDARHRLIHENDVLDLVDGSEDDTLQCVEDALWLTSQFEEQYLSILESPKYASLKDGEGMDDAVQRVSTEIEAAFDHIKTRCDVRQHKSLENLKRAFFEYLWARCDFVASVFVVQQSEWSRAQFLDLAPEYKTMLTDLALKQSYMLSKFPIEEQERDLLDMVKEEGETGCGS
ncbi:hypothetical protein ACQR0Z_09765 [Bradyrhizobium sp. HKCCYLS3077]|uniref:hypothetical protein n=1 Tax=Bradyrhizobium sp. HKCCYLS3077 TaxID=3420761 RepID=UPI003EBE1F79